MSLLTGNGLQVQWWWGEEKKERKKGVAPSDTIR